MDVAKAQELWQPKPGWLNTASYGLPPQPGWDALMLALEEWREGRTSWEGWDSATQRSVRCADSPRALQSRRSRWV